jgi:PII-like signaling protein
VADEEPGIRLMVFLTEDDRSGRLPLYKVLLDRAREDGLAGATVWRGVEGFGGSGRLRTMRFPDAAMGLPLAVEVIDAAERIDAFVSAVKELAPGALVTREPVQMARRDADWQPALDDPSPRAGRRR